MIRAEPHTVVDYSAYVAERTRNFTGREWVFTAIDRWLADPDGSRNFLIVGEPGSGKSTVAARLVQMNSGVAPAVGRLRPGHLAFYHFCQATFDQTLNPLRFIEALSQTLAARYKPFEEAVRVAAERNSHITINATTNLNVGTAQSGADIRGFELVVEIGNISPRAAFDEAVRKPLEALYTGDFNEQMLIMVDSLDEARTWLGENILTLLGDASDDVRDLPSPVRLLVTSRPHAQVLERIGPPGLDLIDDAPDNLTDVRTYAYNRLSWLPEPRRTDLAQRVANEGKGNFLYARYILEDLEREGIPEGDLSELKLPERLEDIYRKFLERVAQNDRKAWSENYKPVIGTLVVARERISEGQLANFTGQAQAQIRMVLEDLLQFLDEDKKSLPREQRTYTIYHRSFADFLLNPDFPGYLWSEPLKYHKLIGDYYRAAYAKNWNKCDAYGLDHLLDHMFVLAKQSNEQDRQDAIQALVSLLLESEFLDAREKRLGLYPVQHDLQRARDLTIDPRDRSRLLRAEQNLVAEALNSFWSQPPDYEPDFKDAEPSWAVWPRPEGNPEVVTQVTAKNGVIYMRQEAQISASSQAVLDGLRPTRTSKLWRFVREEPGHRLVYKLGPVCYVQARTRLAVTTIHDGKSLAVEEHMIWWDKPPSWLVTLLPLIKMFPLAILGLGSGFIWGLLGNPHELYFNILTDAFTNQLRQLNPSLKQFEEIRRLEKQTAWYLSLVALLIVVEAVVLFVRSEYPESFDQPWMPWLHVIVAAVAAGVANIVSRWIRRSATRPGRLMLMARFSKVMASVSIMGLILAVLFFIF